MYCLFHILISYKITLIIKVFKMRFQANIHFNIDGCRKRSFFLYDDVLYKYSIILMHSNLWNLRNCKERLGILERTYAQKRHIESILNIKSSLNGFRNISMNTPTQSNSNSRLISPNTKENNQSSFFKSSRLPNQSPK